MATDMHILVFGATGRQGSSVIQHLKGNSRFKIRGITRNPDSSEAKRLSSEGIEMVKGDMTRLDDSVFKGIDGMFLVTDYWDKSQQNRELEIGKTIVDQAARAGVKTLIYSSLVNVEKESNGKWNVPLFTHKAKLEEYIRKEKSSFRHISFVQPGFFYQNFRIWFRPESDKQGNLTVTLPHCKQIHAVDVCDLGGAVRTILENPDKYNEVDICLQGETASPKKFIDTLSNRLNKPIKLNSVSVDEFSKLGFSGAKELAQMFGWMDEYGYYGSNLDVENGRKLTSLKTFDDWLSQMKEEF